MSGDDGCVFCRIAPMAVLFLLVMPLVSAFSHHAGAASRFLNTYFLPQNAQVTGISGLIFVVLIPFLIVAILLYLGLNSFLPQRQSQALGVLLALFVIPSGGYKLISGLLMSVFGLGNTAPGAPVAGVRLESLPIISTLGLPVVASITAFVLMGYFYQTRGEGEYQTFEFFSSLGVAWIIFTGLGGETISFTALFSSLAIFLIGAYIFQYGIQAPTQSSNLVAFVGVIIMGWAIMTAGFLPANLRGIGFILGGLGIIGFLVIVAIIFLIAILAITCVLEHVSANPFPWPCPF